MDLLDHCEDYEKDLKGNHLNFDSFIWTSRPDDYEEWCLVYTHHRDSETLQLSNSEVFNKELDTDSEYCNSEHHSHWGHGWVKGFSIRCRDKEGNFSEPFKKYIELQLALEDYPVLDEYAYSDMQHKDITATIENLAHSNDSWEFPENYVELTASYLCDNEVYYDDLTANNISKSMEALGFFETGVCRYSHRPIRYEADNFGINSDNLTEDEYENLYYTLTALHHFSLLFQNLNSYKCDFDLIKWYSDRVFKKE